MNSEPNWMAALLVLIFIGIPMCVVFGILCERTRDSKHTWHW